jgi:hypothetical protein
VSKAVRPDALAQDARHCEQQHRCDGGVDEEDPRPAEIRGQHTADEDADGRSAAGGGAPDAERDVAVSPLREGRHQERETGGREKRPAETLEPTEGDERACRPRERAEDGAEPEERNPGGKDPAPSENVAQPASEEQEPAEDDRVRGDDPLEPRLREPEIGLDGGQCDVHDRDVEDHHELCDDDERQRRPRTRRKLASPYRGDRHLSNLSIVYIYNDSTSLLWNRLHFTYVHGVRIPTGQGRRQAAA